MSGADLFADARRFAAYHAAERAMFEATGRWIAEVDEPTARTRIGAWNQLHGEHVARWAARYPTVEELPPVDGWPPGEIDAVIGPALDGPFASTEERLRALGERALPALAAAYRAHRDMVVAALDGPTARDLDLALADTRAELEECQRLLDP